MTTDTSVRVADLRVEHREAFGIGVARPPTPTCLLPLTPTKRRSTDAFSYSMRRPVIARAMTSCWICSVPSKMS